jgi:hypothetical protein
MCDYLAVRRSLAIAAAAACLIVPGAKAVAEAGFYAGGSLGSATIQADIPDAENIDEVLEFDEDDLGWKAFGGYNFGLDFLALAIEAGYVDLGKPSGTFLDNELEVDVTGLDVFGLAGLQLGPIGVFAKAGVISWDIEATIDGIDAGDDDGTDPAYGVGARFNLGSLEIRGEYEMFDLDNVDDVYMLSAGLVWTF